MESDETFLPTEEVSGKAKKQKHVSETEKKRMPLQNALMIVIAVFLFLQVVLSAISLYLDLQRDQRAEMQRANMVQSVNKYTETVNSLTNQMLEQYKKEVYGGGKVNTAEKQIVMGTEYNFMGLMLLVRQTNEIIKMLTQLK